MPDFEFGDFRKLITDDFEKQTDGIEDVFGRILTRHLSNTKIDSTKLQANIGYAIKQAFRDVGNDVVDKIDLSDWIDVDSAHLKKYIHKMYQDIESGAVEEVDDISKQLFAALQVAFKRGVDLKIDTPKFKMDNAGFRDYQNQLKEYYNITDETVAKIDQRLSDIGVGVGDVKVIEQIKDEIDNIGFDNIKKELDSVQIKVTNIMKTFAEFYEMRKAQKESMSEYGFAFDSKTGHSTQLTE